MRQLGPAVALGALEGCGVALEALESSASFDARRLRGSRDVERREGGVCRWCEFGAPLAPQRGKSSVQRQTQTKLHPTREAVCHLGSAHRAGGGGGGLGVGWGTSLPC